MVDKNVTHLNLLYPPFKDKVVPLIALGYDITESIRSLKTQEAIYFQGRMTPGPIISNAKPGLSKHHYGLAVDLKKVGKVPYPPEKEWAEVLDKARTLGLKCGADFKNVHDICHFEYSVPYSGAELYEIYKKYGLSQIWQYLNELKGDTFSITYTSILNRIEQKLKE